MEIAKIAFAPYCALFGVPSAAIRARSTAGCSMASSPTTASARKVLAARAVIPPSRARSTSTVGLPQKSRILRARMD
jgi:hypothetical protein